ncbi:MAG: NaeI family type II restriction endonuclease [Propionibacteriaceae bacterium]|nr:NaeI family type II restriction endonuclease [Propionibacteriaceae bacterium]
MEPEASTILKADPELAEIVDAIRRADPDGSRAARVFRETFDQLYDGEHTGRYSVEQLYKTEKTHFGTLIEINLRREFKDIIADGDKLDYKIAGHDIDCKFSFTDGGWMLPPESFNLLLLVTTADDGRACWSLGVVRANEDKLRGGGNRDEKKQFAAAARKTIVWLFRDAPMTENILLSVDAETREAIMSLPSGQQRLNELFRRVTNRRIGRGVVATVGQQKDYMKRVRANGGSRTALAPEGYVIPGGDYESHRLIAEGLGIAVPGEGEFVSVQVVPATQGEDGTVLLDGSWWRVARPGEKVTEQAPLLPETKKPK